MPLVNSCILHCLRAIRSAFCMSDEGQSGLQKPGIGAPRGFPESVRTSRYVVAGRALADLGGSEAPRWEARRRVWRHVRGAAHAKE